MTRLKAISPDEATGKTKELFDAIHNKFGVVPNMMRTMGNSPALLSGYLNLSDALAHGTLNAKTGKLLSMAIAENNGCDYCLSVHTYLGENLLRMDSQTLNNARNAIAADAKTEAALEFANILINKKGSVSDADVATVKEAGFTDGEIGELVGHVALNILTNYFNNTANTEIDFPVIRAHKTIDA